jgi:CheY-like chemotaxis protein
MKGILQKSPILLVEDNEDDIVITKRALEKVEIMNNLYIVNDGQEALNFLKRTGKYKNVPRPGFVLLDLKMPKLDGFEVLKEIKRTPELKIIPIIILTTSERDEDISRAYALGCNSYIVKSVDYTKFINIVIKIKQYWLELTEIPLPSDIEESI